MRTAQLVGRICTDISKREAGQYIIYTFLLACQGRKKDESHFFACEAWGKTGEGIAQYFKKGSPIELICTAEHERWEKDGQKHEKVKFNVNHWGFVPSNKNENKQDSGSSEPSNTMSDDDITF